MTILVNLKIKLFFIESQDPLQLCISSLNYLTYVKCCDMLEIFLNNIYRDYDIFLANNNHPFKCLRASRNEYIVNRF